MTGLGAKGWARTGGEGSETICATARGEVRDVSDFRGSELLLTGSAKLLMGTGRRRCQPSGTPPEVRLDRYCRQHLARECGRLQNTRPRDSRKSLIGNAQSR